MLSRISNSSRRTNDHLYAGRPTSAVAGGYVENAAKWGVAGLNIGGSRRFSGQGGRIKTVEGRWPANVVLDDEASAMLGGPARFFYCAKASRSERGVGNNHPTVKPLALMEWLCRLTATPTGGIVFDPFAGSGSTLIAAKNVGRESVGIEINREYCQISAARLAARTFAAGHSKQRNDQKKAR